MTTKMKLMPNNSKREDCVQTPQDVAQKMVYYFRPKGKVLEPCKGEGNILKYLINADWCEIKEDRDFLEYKDKVDWIITNPPYSKFRAFLKKSMEVSDNIVFLCTINHIWLKARIRDIKEANFGIKEIWVMETPNTFPQSGFQVGCVWLKRGYKGDIKYNQ